MEEFKGKQNKEPGILDSMENLLILAKKLQNVYEKRPDLTNFIGCMAGKGDPIESRYSVESIKKDEDYVIEKRKEIEESNRSFGQENFDRVEGGFQLSEIMQALIVDLMNRDWFKDCKTVMTSDFDDLKVGVDAVMKRGEKGYLGMSFDFTVSSQDKKIYEKLTKEWDRNIKDGKITIVKYFEDPDTKQKGSLLVPKFIIGASKKDVEDFARAYLYNDVEKLNNHPFNILCCFKLKNNYKRFLIIMKMMKILRIQNLILQEKNMLKFKHYLET